MDKNSDQDFRDRPINIDASGQRKRINAKQPNGKWYTRRNVVGYALILFLVIAPLLKIHGHPFMMLDILNRKFYIFGLMVFAEDTYILALVMAVAVVSIVLFTVVFGRLFCGWACPQTLFLELVYRKIEFLFDGNGRKGKKKKDESNPSLIRTLAKHTVYILISIFFTNVFLLWFIGPEQLLKIITEPVSDHLAGFLIMMALSVFYYWVYSYFREQICTLFCPYGRMQGVLLDNNSISVIYDYKRGEPRNSKVSEGGDCINCLQCISVCPTGIDIRNGSQLECIHCAACIDECNLVMKKINKPYNLIRYDSVTGVEIGKRSLLNTRSIAYTGVLVLLMVILAFTVGRRTTIDVTLWRAQGTLYQQLDSETYSNIYQVMFLNKGNEPLELTLRLLDFPNGELSIADNKVVLPPNGKMKEAMIIKLKKSNLTGRETVCKIGLFSGDQLKETVTTNFLGP
ncbi:MAG: cytochrome c oxidase accessory protein CcoG [Prolixibacteraceae bacterium]